MEEQGFFYRDTWAEIDLDCILANVASVKKHLPQDVNMIAVVKANAYGHGDIQVAETALEAGAAYLAVAFMDEAIALRKKGITAPILVLGAARPEDVQVAAKFNITLTAFQKEWLQEAIKHLKTEDRISFHIKVDTGMGRIGVRSLPELTAIEQIISENDQFILEGIYTHFATADELDETYFRQQLALFDSMANGLKEQPKYIHSSNSAAALRYPSAYFNAVRIGIAMYGLTPSLEMESEIPFPLREAFSLRSRLVHVKKLQKGEKVSYGATYETGEEEWIGTIPIGYADGWIRKLQGQEVLVKGTRSPIVGRICMDQCMIRLPYHVPIGTTVTLIGGDEDQFISVNEIAQKLDTINYEVPCIIANRVPRLYKKGGKIVDLKNYLLED
ncbi:alanine racemase [Bacillus sp. ISL-40]|uniref:alanine racemase n=1 Tax=unclassified Bacillus (in: firmicutes) TaxID=185979 RepID=UPI001BEC6B93|nr:MULTISPECIES: alanine racemase [unclassified Bacillus (in: firmicutes)]MBT2699775.1 alanine racemase [Bacillus sp. ISL-40]MBT2722212.1 alanine racemase [Bacillus sp. ISL-46]MBT2740631.1 alanine racemase [Bacillus sp. ISL-77]